MQPFSRVVTRQRHNQILSPLVSFKNVYYIDHHHHHHHIYYQSISNRNISTLVQPHFSGTFPPPSITHHATSHLHTSTIGHDSSARTLLATNNTLDHLHAILHTFPQIDYIMAYGSGVFAQTEKHIHQHHHQQQQQQQQQQHHLQHSAMHSQTSTSSSSFSSSSTSTSTSTSSDEPMIDLIFGVHDVRHFHEQLLSVHPSHYAFLFRLFGAQFTQKIQELGHARIFYNTLVSMKVTPFSKPLVRQMIKITHTLIYVYIYNVM